MANIYYYPYGFIFSDKKLSNFALENYDEITILNKYYFKYDVNTNLNVEYIDDNNFIIIHGHWCDTRDPFINKGDFLKNLLYLYLNDFEKFLNEIDYIAGRYVLMVGDLKKVLIFQDATGTRSVYYSTKHNIISSHANLINDIYKHNETEYIDIINHYATAAHLTKYSNIFSMIPNLYLEYPSMKNIRFFPRDYNYDLTIDEVCNRINILWKNQLEYYSNNHNNLVFSLSGGGDSRFLLAMARNYMNKFKVFTYTVNTTDNEITNFQKTMLLDRQIVEQILKQVQLNHNYIYFKADRTELKNIEPYLNKNSLSKHGRSLIVNYLKLFPQKNVMHMRGNLLEIGRAYWISNINRDASLDRLKYSFMFKFNKKIKDNSISKDDLEKVFNNFLQILNYNNIYDYNIIDLFYWEYRMGRWMPEVLNETDLAFNTFMPFNCREIIKLFLSVPIKDRKNGTVFRKLIDQNFPLLNYFGINNPKTTLEQLEETKELLEETKELLEETKELLSKIKNDKLKYIKVKFETFYKINESRLPYNLNSEENPILLKMDKELIKPNNELICDFFINENGVFSLLYQSPYFNEKATNNILIKIFKNKEHILTDDIALWNKPSHILIPNVTKGDKISLVISPQKELGAESWENASKTYIFEASIFNRANSINKVTSSNPFVKFIKNKKIPWL